MYPTWLHHYLSICQVHHFFRTNWRVMKFGNHPQSWRFHRKKPAVQSVVTFITWEFLLRIKVHKHEQQLYLSTDCNTSLAKKQKARVIFHVFLCFTRFPKILTFSPRVTTRWHICTTKNSYPPLKQTAKAPGNWWFSRRSGFLLGPAIFSASQTRSFPGKVENHITAIWDSLTRVKTCWNFSISAGKFAELSSSVTCV